MANYDSSNTGANIDSAVNQIIDSSTDLNVDSNSLVVDKSENNVGIGVTAPGGIANGLSLVPDLEIRGAAGTGAACAGVLALTTAETSTVDGDVQGAIVFQSPVDGSGTDAILSGAAIWAEADATFSSSVNNTELVFATNTSDAATERMRIEADGTVNIAGNLTVGGTGQGWVKLQSTTVDDDATVDITTGIGSTYDHYMIMVKSVVGVTDGTDLQIKLTVGGALKGADYRYRVLTHSSAGSGFNDNVSDSAATIRYAMAGLGSNASEGGDGVFWFNDPTNTSKFHMIHWNAVYSNPAIHTVSGAGGYTGGTGALTNVQFLMNSGNLESGTFTLYGLSKG